MDRGIKGRVLTVAITQAAEKIREDLGSDWVYVWARRLGIDEERFCAACDKESLYWDEACLICGVKIPAD